MSDLELAFAASKRFEGALERLGATGKGLHEKATSIEAQLDPVALGYLRMVASIRNRLAHEDGFDRIPDPQLFNEACQQLDAYFSGFATKNHVPALGSCELQRYVEYRGFGEDATWIGSPGTGFPQLIERWEAASGLRYVDDAQCRADVEHWVMFSANMHLVRMLDSQFTGFVTTVARPEFSFALHPHVTKPSATCERLARAIREFARTDLVIHRSCRIGVDSHHREAVMVRHAGVRITENFFGQKKIERVKDQTVVSLL